MPRAPSEKVKEAEKLYRSGMKLVEIASQLGVPDGTVRRWKSTYCWNNKSERSKRKSERSKQIPMSVNEVMTNSELNDKQQLFCLYFVKSFNATKSYQKAYGCSYDTALVSGPRLMGNARVKAEIQKLKQERYTREFLSEEDIFQKYMDIAFADISDYLEWGQEEIPIMGPFGPLKDDDGNNITKIVNVAKLKESIEVDGTIISEVKLGKCGETNIKLADRMKALDWLAAHMNMATDKQRAEIAVLRAKAQTNADDEEITDDGFIDALNASAKEDWSDEED